MSRTRTPGDGPKCTCGMPAVWSSFCQMTDGHGYCNATHHDRPAERDQRAPVLYLGQNVGVRDTEPPPPLTDSEPTHGAPSLARSRADVWLSCGACGLVGAHSPDVVRLSCSRCGHTWGHPARRTAAELIRLIRARLAEDQDASRRSFYNSGAVLYDIAEAVDAYEDRARYAVMWTRENTKGPAPVVERGWHLLGAMRWTGIEAEAMHVAHGYALQGLLACVVLTHFEEG